MDPLALQRYILWVVPQHAIKVTTDRQHIPKLKLNEPRKSNFASMFKHVKK